VLAKLSGLRSAHIESGLRSHGIFDPFPEELTRILVFKLSDYFFAPGEKPYANVQHYRGFKINTHYNTLIDSLVHSRDSRLQTTIDIPEGPYCVASIHRFENIFNRQRLKLILDMLDRISGSIKVLFILHRPTRVRLETFGFMDELEGKQNIEVRPRYDYFSFVRLIEKSEFVITDGGSNQEECYYLGKPCILFRKKTERNEGIDENVLLSNLDWPRIETFVIGYKKYQRPPVTPEISPSQLIIDRLVADGLSNDYAH
jgi:UDP-N-acetylglucosamine 2-epimerase (non-hydrolysing)